MNYIGVRETERLNVTPRSACFDKEGRYVFTCISTFEEGNKNKRAKKSIGLQDAMAVAAVLTATEILEPNCIRKDTCVRQKE